MSPTFSHNELANGVMAETIISANIGHSLACEDTGSNISDKIGSNCLSIAATSKRVTDIGFSIRPLKIIDAVISPNKIKMINHRKISGVGDESHGDQTVDAMMLSGEGDAEISIKVRFGAKDLFPSPVLHNSAASNEFDDAINTSNPSKVGDFVNPFVAGDWAPLFNHELGYIPGHGASQIKEIN